MHKGETIYIVGSGKSIDYYDKSFFKDKITIGINQVFLHIQCTYSIRKELAMLSSVLMQADRSSSSETVHFVSCGNCGQSNQDNFKLVQNLQDAGKMDSSRICVYLHNRNVERVHEKDFEMTNAQDRCLLVSHSTLTSALHLAAKMGAKTIVLVGCEGCAIDGEVNFEGYHTDDTIRIAHPSGKSGYVKWLDVIQYDTLELKKMLFDAYGCHVVSALPFTNLRFDGHVIGQSL